MEPLQTKKGIFLVLLGALCFSTTGTAQALAPAQSSPYVIGAVRLLGGGLLLLLLLLLTGRSKTLFSKEPWPASHLCLASLGLLAFQLFFFAAVARIGVAMGTVIAIGLSPVCTGLLGLVVLKEIPDRRWYPATAVALAGLAVLTLLGGGDEASQAAAPNAANNLASRVPGLLMAVAAGAAYAVFQISGKRLVARRPPEAVMAAVACIGGCCMLPALIFFPELWPTAWIWDSLRGAAVSLHLALVTMALAFTFYLGGLRFIPVALGATLGLAEPLGAALIGILFLHEALTPASIGGIALLFASLVVLLLPSKR